MTSPDAPQSRIQDYVRIAGLPALAAREAGIERGIRDLMDALADKIAVSDPSALYRYPVPMLGEDGTCSVLDEMAPVPYDLAAILGGLSDQTTRRLALLERLVERTQETTGADWIGIYQRRVNAKGAPVLVKISYIGRPSRAEFPLTREFAERSTNSAVGLTGRATIIEDVRKHVEAGGGFYVCDADVQSEACVPILGEGRQVLGVVDAEAKPRGFFGVERVSVIAALALVCAAVLP